MKFDVMTLFPGMMEAILSESILGRARAAGLIETACYNIRDYSADKHHRVDDTPYGGGMGMLMSPAPVCACYDAITAGLPKKPHTVYMSPKGRVLSQAMAARLLEYEHIVILCGHYEGIDQRILEEIVDEEISVGDYVVTGGELPAAILIDCVSRLVPGVLADAECFEKESHADGLLEYPQYTRPFSFRGREVPEILISGHHENIEKWRFEESLRLTMKNRPDLLIGRRYEGWQKKIFDTLKKEAEGDGGK